MAEVTQAVRRVEQRLERAEAEEPILAAPDGTVAVAIEDLRALVNEYTRLRDMLALSDRDWSARWYGSEPLKGSHIHTVTEHGSYGEMVAFVGSTEAHHAEAGKIVAAHNAFLARHRTEAVKPLVEALEACRRVLFERIPRISPEGPDTEAEQREYDEIGGAWSMADAALRSVQS